MRKMVLILAAASLALAAPLTVLAMEPEAHDMKMEHGEHGMKMAGVAHEEVVNGVKASFKVATIKEAMEAMKMELPKGMKETHHVSVEFKDVKTGKPLTDGTVTVKVQGPDKNTQTKDLMGMQGHFGADFDLSKKGKYGVMAKFKLADGKVRSAKFWYTVK